jgi:hypothetical protein
MSGDRHAFEAVCDSVEEVDREGRMCSVAPSTVAASRRASR